MNRKMLFFLALVVLPCAAYSEETATNKAALNSIREKGSPYVGFRSWKPVNPEPKAVKGRNLAACDSAPQSEERGSPHTDGFINVYVSESGREAYLKGKSKEFAEGTVIVKEKLAKKSGHVATELGVMIKREKGFAPNAGDWQFIFVDAKGTVTDQQSKLENCAACHRLRQKNDYVFRSAVPMPAKGNRDGNSRK